LLLFALSFYYPFLVVVQKKYVFTIILIINLINYVIKYNLKNNSEIVVELFFIPSGLGSYLYFSSTLVKAMPFRARL